MNEAAHYVFVVLEMLPSGNVVSHGAFGNSFEAHLRLRNVQRSRGDAEQPRIWVTMSPLHLSPPMEP